MSKWIRENNVFLSRFTVEPSRRQEFLAALEELCANANHWYEEGCTFAFQGWARNPNQWVAIACWKSEEYLDRMRETPWFMDCQKRMLDCCSEPMTMEQFSGMDHDREVFSRYPTGSSPVHTKTKSLDVVFL
jgi:quinol monooxygenase YgiN